MRINRRFLSAVGAGYCVFLALLSALDGLSEHVLGKSSSLALFDWLFDIGVLTFRGSNPDVLFLLLAQGFVLMALALPAGFTTSRLNSEATKAASISTALLCSVYVAWRLIAWCDYISYCRFPNWTTIEAILTYSVFIYIGVAIGSRHYRRRSPHEALPRV